MDRYLVGKSPLLYYGRATLTSTVLQHQPEKQVEKAAEIAAREEELARLKERHDIE